MHWRDALLDKCYEIMQKGGEVRIQFRHRQRDKKLYVVPIINVYANNQKICDELEMDIDD